VAAEEIMFIKENLDFKDYEIEDFTRNVNAVFDYPLTGHEFKDFIDMYIVEEALLNEDEIEKFDIWLEIKSAREYDVYFHYWAIDGTEDWIPILDNMHDASEFIEEIRRSAENSLIPEIKEKARQVLKLYDKDLERLWQELGTVPVTKKAKSIAYAWEGWEKDTPIEIIWNWFDTQFSKGLNGLIYSLEHIDNPYGSRNVGDNNAGINNTGCNNNGSRNSGTKNEGCYNTGNCNLGNYNTGQGNIGDNNTGFYNEGNYNVGNYNRGNCNSGDWNYTTYSSGCFNTKVETVMFFDEPSNMTLQEWRTSKACSLLQSMPRPTDWTDVKDMTEELKELNPEHEVTKGILRMRDIRSNAQNWWNNLSEEDKDTIKSIPNFDGEKFYKITGIVTYRGFPSEGIVNRLRNEYPEGCKVMLERMNDIQAPPLGTLGTVKGVDDAGHVLVRWDNGSSLSVVYGVDSCRKVNACSMGIENSMDGILSLVKDDSYDSLIQLIHAVGNYTGIKVSHIIKKLDEQKLEEK